MPVRRWFCLGSVFVLVACQAPAPLAPTAAPRPPTAPTPAASTPTAVVAPTAIPPTAVVAPTAIPATAVVAPTAIPPAASASRIEALNAANAAFRSGDLKTAAGLYDRVANTPPGQAEAPTASAAIDDFARFRRMVTLLADGREDEARTDLTELQKRDPNAPLARLGSQLYDQYGMTGQLRGACAQLQPQLTSQAGPTLATLQGLGVVIDTPTLCSVPQG